MRTIVHLILAFAWCQIAMAAPLPEKCPKHFVTDLQGVMAADSLKALDAQLRQYEQRTGNRIMVVVTDTLQATPLGDKPAERLLRDWHLGSERALLLLIVQTSPDTRSKAYIAVGTPFAERFPYLFCKHLCSDRVVGPVYDGHTHYYALTHTLPLIQGVMEGSYSAEQYHLHRAGKGWMWIVAAGVVILLLMIILPKTKAEKAAK
ncbi:MAG: TPM domain-containing protein [Sodaliphilus sp.]